MTGVSLRPKTNLLYENPILDSLGELLVSPRRKLLRCKNHPHTFEEDDVEALPGEEDEEDDTAAPRPFPFDTIYIHDLTSDHPL